MNHQSQTKMFSASLRQKSRIIDNSDDVTFLLIQTFWLSIIPICNLDVLAVLNVEMQID